MDASSPSAPRWVDRLFSRLQVRYGSAWTRMWVGIEPESVKADWASMLGQLFDRNPIALVYGLDHLPDTPPTVGAFLKLCLAAPDERKAMAAPVSKPDRDFAEMVHKRIVAATKTESYQSPAAVCAAKLRRKMADGFRLTPSQRHVLECCERQIGGLMPPSEDA